MNRFPEIPGYDLKKHLGGGGMADVFMAVPHGQNRLVAIKVMTRTQLDPRHARRFIKEAQTLSDLKHPGIVRVLGAGRTAQAHYIVMEFFPESLGDRLRRQGRLPPDEALAIAGAVAETLYFIHRQGIIHRDVKPDNIMFRTDGQPVLLDFGIARALGTRTRLTATGMVLGTPRYMSPEQIKTEKLDGRSDIYSLGVVLFEMVAGREPFPGDHIAAVTYKQLMEPVPLLPAETAFLQPVVARMMAKERSTRPGSEEEWRLLVRPVLRPFTLPRVAAVKVPRVPPEERQPTRISPSRKNPPKKRRSQANRRPGKTSRWRWHLALIGVLVAFFLFNLDLLPGWGRAAWAWLSALVKSAMPPPP